jgi:hypothetical protein
MDLPAIARLVLDQALQARLREGIALVVRHNRVEIVVFDPERDRRIGTSKIVETGYWLKDHKVTVEILRGVIRVHHVDPLAGSGPFTRDQSIPLDDADSQVVGAMVRRAIEAGRTPF